MIRLSPLLKFSKYLSFSFAFFFFFSNTSFAQNAVKEKLDAHRKLANKINKITDNGISARYADSLMRVAKAAGDQSWQAQILLAKSSKAFKIGDQRQALEFAREATDIALPMDSITYVKAPLMMAFTLNRQGKDDEALEIAFKMMRKADEQGWKKLGIECRNCIADIYRTRHEAEKALPYALQSSKDALELKDTAAYVYSLSTLSNIYSTDARDAPDRLAKAAAYSEQILSAPLVGYLTKFDKARYLSNLGRLYEMMGKYRQAEQILQQSIAISRAEGFDDTEQHALNEMMTVKLSQNLYQEAINFGQKALEILPDAQSSQMQRRNIYDRLAEANEGLKNFEQAFNYTTKARSIDDSLTNLEKSRITAQMDEAYRTDKHIQEADSDTKLMKQQRNFIIAVTIAAIIAFFSLYQWILFQKNKRAGLLAEEHRQLARLDELKTKFFSNISHELRTPLTLIVGPIDQLRNREDYQLTEVQQQGYIETIWLNSKKLLSMFNELLDLSKIESGSLPVKLQPVEIQSLFNLFYQGFASSAEYKRILFSLSSAFKPGMVAEIDKDKLEKIVNNLIGNAIKFTPAYGAIVITADRKPFGLEITVKDTGAGIPQENLSHVFDRYYQVDTEGTPASGGTGIGLAIAKEYTEILHGRITVESIVGEGTSFTVFIPMEFKEMPIAGQIAPSTEIPDHTEEMAIADTVVQSEIQNVILLVEDQLEMSQYISSVLKPFYRVEVAINGIDALERLEQLEELPALIISDVMMPGMGGFELLEHLKKHDTYFRIPVVMLTAVADADNRLNALNIGVDDYLTKPFVSSELLARSANLINNAIGRTRYSADQESVALFGKEVEKMEIEHVSPADLVWLNKLENLIRSNAIKGDLELASVSYHMATSERQLYRTIKSITGLTPNKYIRTIRLQIAREAIESGKYRTVAEISHIAGFDTPAYFSKLFKESFGRDVVDLL